MRTSSTFGLVLAFLTATTTVSLSTQGTRDGGSQTVVSGSAEISGTVVAADPSSTPVRRARVMLNSVDRSVGRAVTTDDNGRFRFAGLPGGRYLLEAAKPAWLNGAFGAVRPGRAGTAIVLADAERSAPVVLRMFRGAVVSGTVRDHQGQPAEGVTVVALRPQTQGELTVLATASPTAVVTTADDGSYRAYGLPPGKVVMIATRTASAEPVVESYRPTSQSDIARALQGVASASDRTGRVAPAPVFHPSVTDPAEATILTLEAGEERTGVDISLRIVPVARLEGVVTGPGGAPWPGAQLTLTSTGPTLSGGTGINGVFLNTTDREGRYRFSALLPGGYALIAGALAKPPTPGDGPHVDVDLRGALYAATDVTVSGRDLDVPLSLQPMLTVSGRVVFEGSTSSASTPALSVRLQRVPQLMGGGGAQLAPGVTDFSILGVIPGRYRLTVTVPPGSAWTAKSSVIRGQDSLDVPFEIRPGENISDWVMTVTDRPSELSGTLTDTAGKPAAEYFIVVFTADRAYWTPPSRRVVQTRPGIDGRFSIKGLPAGDYLVAALADLELGEPLQPAMLNGLVDSAVRVKIADQQRTAQDLRVGGR